MDIIHIDPKSYELLVDWETENDLLVRALHRIIGAILTKWYWILESILMEK